MVNDPIADTLTRIRNALRNRQDQVSMPYARTRHEAAQVLKREGYVREVISEGAGQARILTVRLKYGPQGEQVIRHLERVSTPARRLYRGAQRLPKILDGLGILVVSTSRGVLSDREARKQKVGGELLFKVW